MLKVWCPNHSVMLPCIKHVICAVASTLAAFNTEAAIFVLLKNKQNYLSFLFFAVLFKICLDDSW